MPAPATSTAPNRYNAYGDGAAYIDGHIVPISHARIPIVDWGFLHSDATYDVVHVWENRYFRLNEHLDRFFSGIEKLNMHIDFSREDVTRILDECVNVTGLSNAYVEMICTRGLPAPGSRDPRDCANRFYAFVVPFSWVATRSQQDEGVRLFVSDVQRIAPQSVDPTIKNYHWLDLVRGQFDAYDAGAHLAVLTDGQGNVTEGAGFNVFAILGSTVVTPKEGVLKGITRQTAMELAMQMGLVVEERPLPTDALMMADEVFLTSTAGGIMPVKYVNDQPLGDGAAPLATQLRELYWALHTHPTYSTPVPLSPVSASRKRKTYVLAHGSWHGGWCWEPVAERLLAAGHRVYAPSYTGMGDRAHLLHKDITIHTFVDDLVQVIETNELDDVILVGHSFSGVPITGVAERIPERIGHLVYLDAVVLESGRHAFSNYPKDEADARIASAFKATDGLAVPVPGKLPAVWGISPDRPEYEWVTRRLTPHPLASYTTSLQLQHPIGNGRPRTYMHCASPSHSLLEPSRQLVQSLEGWDWVELDAPHEAHITHPDLVAEQLLKIVPCLQGAR